ncbi:lipopolysaccharide biosynthesis protein [uncultured Holdemanella sp.]|uniref:lipopolysaccharide biosynthesis protein n=1 Tax=uncultured Holdemanella sp. TaxID=1763549 RepID=UPI0026599383|nr:lipopolysaccharide biosynthesis protein [uncultured Holdemanella sp.]
MTQTIDKNKFKKNFLWNVIGMTCNCFNSLFFMILITRINSMDDAGIFTLSFSIACLVYYIGTYAGRVYQVTNVNDSITDSDFIIHRAITCVMMVFISLMYCFISGYSLYKFTVVILLCIYKSLEAFSDVLYGVVQKNNNLYQVGISLTIKSVFALILFVVVDIVTRNIIYSILFAILAWILVIVLYDFKNVNYVSKFKLHFNISSLRDIFKNGFFVFIINFLSSYIVNAPKYALDGRASNELQAIFGIILMPATLISLGVQYFIQPFLEQLTSSFKNNDKKAFNKVVIKLLFITSGLGVICLIGAYILGIPVLSLVYGLELSAYLFELEIIIFGSILFALSLILSSALITVRYNFIQFIVFVITSVFGFFISIILITRFSIDGAAYAYSCIMLLEFFLYGLIYLMLQKNLFKNLEKEV